MTGTGPRSCWVYQVSNRKRKLPSCSRARVVSRSTLTSMSDLLCRGMMNLPSFCSKKFKIDSGCFRGRRCNEMTVRKVGGWHPALYWGYLVVDLFPCWLVERGKLGCNKVGDSDFFFLKKKEKKKKAVVRGRSPKGGVCALRSRACEEPPSLLAPLFLAS
jgi:hypothetical protein